MTNKTQLSDDRYQVRLEDFITAYKEAALWSSTDMDDAGTPLDENYDTSDFSSDLDDQMSSDCSKFFRANFHNIQVKGVKLSDDGSGRASHAGHDFWLTRCGHGAGFWDGDWPEPYASILDKAASQFGNVDIYVGDDGQLYGI